jgi:hypothetical protein
MTASTNAPVTKQQTQDAHVPMGPDFSELLRAKCAKYSEHRVFCTTTLSQRE